MRVAAFELASHVPGSPITLVNVAEDLGASAVATFVWPASAVLAQWVFDERAHVAGAAVVELGCGPGLVGLAACAAGADSVVFTDGDAAALACARASLAASGWAAVPTTAAAAPPVGAPVTSVAQLRWGDGAAAAVLLSACRCTAPPALLVLGADVLYESSSHEALLATVRALLRAWVAVNDDGRRSAAAPTSADTARGGGEGHEPCAGYWACVTPSAGRPASAPCAAAGRESTADAGAPAPRRSARFVTAYHVRSATKTIAPLLAALGLRARLLHVPARPAVRVAAGGGGGRIGAAPSSDVPDAPIVIIEIALDDGGLL